MHVRRHVGTHVFVNVFVYVCMCMCVRVCMNVSVFHVCVVMRVYVTNIMELCSVEIPVDLRLNNLIVHVH